MAIRTVAADPEIVRRLGLGTRICVECRQPYNDARIPEWCINPTCPQAKGGHLARHDPEAGSYDRTRDYDTVYHLTAEQGKAIQSRLLELADWTEREGALAWGIRDLAKLFE